MDRNLRYIGQTCNFEERFRSHRQALTRGNHFNPRLQKAFNKGHSFVTFILEYCELSFLDQRERFWIQLYDSTNRLKGFNLETGGAVLNSHSPETIQKRADSRRGKSSSLKGKPRPKAWIEACAKANRGQKRNYSEEHLEAIRYARKQSIGIPRKGISIKVDTGSEILIFDSVRRVAEYLKMNEILLVQKFYKGRHRKKVDQIQIDNFKLIKV